MLSPATSRPLPNERLLAAVVRIFSDPEATTCAGPAWSTSNSLAFLITCSVGLHPGTILSTSSAVSATELMYCAPYVCRSVLQPMPPHFKGTFALNHVLSVMSEPSKSSYALRIVVSNSDECLCLMGRDGAHQVDHTAEGPQCFRRVAASCFHSIVDIDCTVCCSFLNSLPIQRWTNSSAP